ncbi:BTB and MATH domain-containing protein 43 [Halotydeus destructor]|nr:BTB and MATH domain-containing protein 43 [Halotydeus destructor]
MASKRDCWDELVVTDVEIVNFTFRWVIKNIHHGDRVVMSPELTPDPRKTHTFRIKYIETQDEPYDEDGTNNNYVGLFLENMEFDPTDIKKTVAVDFKLMLLDRYDEVAKMLESAYASGVEFKHGETFGEKNFIRSSFLFDSANEIIREDTSLVVHVELKLIIGERHHQIKRVKYQQEDIAQDGVKTQLSKLYANRKETCDVTLFGLNGEGEPCHSHVLLFRSPYFEAKIVRPWMDKDDKKLHLPFDHDVVRDIVYFIYTEKNERLSSKQLFTAAIYLQLDQLIKICTNYWIDQLTPSTAVEIWVLGKEVGSTKLIELGMKSVALYPEEATENEFWKDLTADDLKQALLWKEDGE